MSDEKKFFESMEHGIRHSECQYSRGREKQADEESSELKEAEDQPDDHRRDRKYQKGIIDKFGEVVSDIGSAIYNTGKAVVETVYNIGSSIVSSIGSFFGF